jgi:predicted enzyme related to lactoylglutathione lyase
VTVQGLTEVYMHSRRMKEMVRFYRAIGLPPVKQFTHDDALHVQCRAPGFDLWILEGGPGKAPKPHGAGSTWLCLKVTGLKAAVAGAKRAGGTVLFERESPGKRRAVVLDPDGRAVDLTEAVARARGARP